MAKFYGHVFCLICSHLSNLARDWEQKREQSLPYTERGHVFGALRLIADQCDEAGIVTAAAYIRDQLFSMPEGSIPFVQLTLDFGNLQSMIKSEMQRVEYLRVDKPKFYSSGPLFDNFVTDVFPQLSYDIVEAANCLALNRSTACVFHLMRILEFGVQRFGKKLKVPLVDETVWQKIMDQVNSRITAMPDKPAIKKRVKERYADVAGHLYSVKVAWRNPVMHPKSTYTPEEAEHLFQTVKVFTGTLIKLLKPRSVAEAVTSHQPPRLLRKLVLPPPA